jgi:hypothetical protein
MGGEVFKLLPYRFRDPSGLNHYYHPYQASFSFKNRSHGPGQITYLDGEFRTGGFGADFGFFADLGERDLREIDRTSVEAAYFLSYKPPTFDPDILSEIERLKDAMIDGVRLTRRVQVQYGHTYLLRSINFDSISRSTDLDGSDIAVVLQILESSPEGSITILWKKLAVFPRPLRMHMPDEEYQKKVDALIVELKLQRLRVRISDNCLVKIGIDVDKEFGRLVDVLNERKIPYRGFGNCKQIPLDELLK